MSSKVVVAETIQCQKCKHVNATEFICKAFPFGIPEEVLRNEVIHNKILDHQQGDYIYEEV